MLAGAPRGLVARAARLLHDGSAWTGMDKEDVLSYPGRGSADGQG